MLQLSVLNRVFNSLNLSYDRKMYYSYLTEYQKNMFSYILLLLKALLYINKIHYKAKIQTETER